MFYKIMVFITFMCFLYSSNLFIKPYDSSYLYRDLSKFFSKSENIYIVTSGLRDSELIKIIKKFKKNMKIIYINVGKNSSIYHLSKYKYVDTFILKSKRANFINAILFDNKALYVQTDIFLEDRGDNYSLGFFINDFKSIKNFKRKYEILLKKSKNFLNK